MAKTRKDLRGRSLRKGEVQRQSDKRYMYTYRDPLGRHKYIYIYIRNGLGGAEGKRSKAYERLA